MGNRLLGDPALAWPGMTSLLPTPAELALVSAEARPGEVTLEWYDGTLSTPGATVYRRTESTEWSALGSVSPDGTGLMVFRDRQVAPATRYGYRLGVAQAGGERFAGEAWVNVPSAAFALEGARPNPVTRGFTVAFSLADAGPARLDVMDLAGRRVFGREVGALGPGEHRVDLAGGRTPPPGVYLVRLTREGEALTARACVVR